MNNKLKLIFNFLFNLSELLILTSTSAAQFEYTRKERETLDKCEMPVYISYSKDLLKFGHGQPDDLRAVKKYYIKAPFSIDNVFVKDQIIVAITYAPALRSPRRTKHLNYVIENTGVVWVDPATLKSVTVMPPWRIHKIPRFDTTPFTAKSELYHTINKEDQSMLDECSSIAVKDFLSIAKEKNIEVNKQSESLFSWFIKSPYKIEDFCKKDDLVIVSQLGPNAKNSSLEESILQPIQMFAVSWTNPISKKTIFLSAPWITYKYEE
jgi:hypothetical protein